MKLNLLVATLQLNSEEGRMLGTGTVEGLRHLAEVMAACGIQGDIFDLPNSSRNANTASPFSLNNGFALTTDELNVFKIPELDHDPQFLSHLQQLHQIHQRTYQQSRVVSYMLKRTVMPWILEKAFTLFQENASARRKTAFAKFCQLATYWLDEYALYEVYREEKIDFKQVVYRKINSPQVKSFIDQHRTRIGLYQYCQFLCYEQRKAVHQRLQELGVGLTMNLPFGVEFDSADVFFHPEVFDSSVQVGCSPEPEHGYDEQSWGVAVYREQSAGLQRYLTEKMNWISQLGDGVFLDHLVGWCGQYVVPLLIPEESVYPHGHFLTEDHQKRMENLTWFLEVIGKFDLLIRGEVAGDGPRVEATQEVIAEFKKKGRNINAMAIPRWEARENRLQPLAVYQPSTLMMVETHDTSTLLQYLLNKKGFFDDFESLTRILEFCQRVLGLPFLSRDIPLSLADCDETFWFEICRRLCQGTPSTDVVFTLPSLISLLSPRFRSPTVENNINIKPGTSGAVGNGWRNWSYFSPPLESMLRDPQLKTSLAKLSQREFRPFDHFHIWPGDPLLPPQLEIIYTRRSGRELVYKDASGSWRTYSLSSDWKQVVQLELVIGNLGEEEIWQRIDLGPVLNLASANFFQFQDLNHHRKCYGYSADDLTRNHFFIKLQPGQIHHFLVYQGEDPLPLILPA